MGPSRRIGGQVSRSNFSRGLPSSGDLKQRPVKAHKKQHRRYRSVRGITGYAGDNTKADVKESVAHQEAAGEAKIKKNIQRSRGGMFAPFTQTIREFFRRWG